jgi:phospholipase A1
LQAQEFDFERAVEQEVDEDALLKEIDRQPSFGLYKENYFITGIPLDRKISKHSADAKFQISIRQRLSKTVLPYNTLLMLTYTQKSFWDIYAKSSPFADNNYNPGLALTKPLIYKNRLRGVAIVAVEHESNGQGDSLLSRSWNYLTVTGGYFLNPYISLQAKVWAGWSDGENKDLHKYRGYGLIAVNYCDLKDRFLASATINPRNKFGRFNTQLELSLKLSRKSNQYLFLQWYQGYGESFLEYNKYSSMLRFGICIRPPLRNLY